MSKKKQLKGVPRQPITSVVRLKFYMVRLRGGDWDPKVKHKTLTEAMQEAAKLAEKFNKPATVLQSVCSVEYVDGKPVWTERVPEA